MGPRNNNGLMLLDLAINLIKFSVLNGEWSQNRNTLVLFFWELITSISLAHRQSISIIDPDSSWIRYLIVPSLDSKDLYTFGILSDAISFNFSLRLLLKSVI